MALEAAGMWQMIGASQTKRDVKGQGGGGKKKAGMKTTAVRKGKGILSGRVT